MIALVAVGFVLPWLIVLGAMAAERWLESSLAKGDARVEMRRD